MLRFSVMAALLLSVAPLCAADPSPPDDSNSTPWYKRLFSSDPKPKTEPRPAPPAEKPLTRKDVARSLEQEQNLYMERLKFCTKLKQIAVQTNDDDLYRKALDLEKQANEVYDRRTSKLPALLDSVKQSEAALDQRTNAPATGSASTTGSASASDSSSNANRVVTGRAPNGRPVSSAPVQE